MSSALWAKSIAGTYHDANVSFRVEAGEHVDFTFSADQEDLRRTVRAFLASRSPKAYVQAMAEDDRGFTDEVWDEVVAMGWPALLVPEEHGGLGLGLVDMVVVMEEMGRALFPGPWLSSAVLATLAARQLGLSDQLASLAAGTTRGTVALEEAGAGDPVTRVRTRAIRKHGRWRLTGTKPVVLDGHTADWALVVARTEQGIGTFLVEAPGGELVPSWDQTRKVARLELDGREATPVGPDGDHTRAWQRIVDDTNVAVCAELVGVMEAANDLAVEYAKVRVQFGRPIGSFQAIKHKCADMLLEVESGKSAAYYASWAAAEDNDELPVVAALSKAYCSEAYFHAAAENIQIHGGIGFTWEHPAHLYFKRAKSSEIYLGDPTYHRELLAQRIGI
jgi:alkylation response protein AidB-like acyl-CoA dehydrogenase